MFAIRLHRLSLMPRSKTTWPATVLATLTLMLVAFSAQAFQTVTLDFDTFTIPGDPDDHIYTPEERGTILGMLEEIYRSPPGDPMGGAFGIAFEILDPLDPPVPFTTSIVKFNTGAFGSSDGIDFRNQDDSDDVTVNATGMLSLFVGTPRDPDLGGGVWSAGDLSTSEAFIMASVNTAAHELGHALGLRHHDSFGPIGAGIGVAASKYDPVYPGPVGSTLASQHIMGLNSAVALNANTLLTPSYFSERSALKLTLAAIDSEIGPNPFLVDESEYPGGDASDDASLADESPIPVLTLGIPNTLESPHAWAPIHGGPDFLPAGMGVVTGSIETRPIGETGDTDHFELFLPAPARVTAEVISDANVNTGTVVNPILAILDGVTTLPVPYETGSAITDDQFESTDAILFDVLLPAGVYIVEVYTDSPMEIGDYELLVYAYPDIDFPLIGDYNDDGFVDAADYTVYRDNLGTSFALPNRDPASGGLVSTLDFDIWVENFGEFKLDALPSSSASVPEPAALAILAMGFVGTAAVRRRD